MSYDIQKSLDVAQYILEGRQKIGDTVTPMQLIKLVYIAHGFMLGRFGRVLLNEPIEAWRYGPVVKSVYHSVSCFGSQPVESVSGGSSGRIFSQDERVVLDYVINTFGGIDGLRLSSATHIPNTPWSITTDTCPYNSDISTDLIESHYNRLLKSEVAGL